MRRTCLLGTVVVPGPHLVVLFKPSTFAESGLTFSVAPTASIRTLCSGGSCRQSGAPDRTTAWERTGGEAEKNISWLGPEVGSTGLHGTTAFWCEHQ